MLRTAGAALALLVVTAGVAGGSPMVGASANTIPRGAFMLDTWVIWKDYTRSYDAGWNGWVDFPDSSQVQAASLVPRVYYGVADWLTLRLALPLEHRFESFPEEAGEKSVTGFGDVVLDPKIQVFRGEEGYPRIALLTGVRFPTGDTRSDPRTSDGSTDFLIGAASTDRFGESLVGHLCVTYWANGESENGNDLDDLWIASLSFENRVSERWTILWEGKLYSIEAFLDSYRFYVCPGIQWTDGDRLTIGASALVSAASVGADLGSRDYDWAPFFKMYYRFF